MGKRDIGGRETKKPKKDTKKAIMPTVMTPPVEVQVFRKKRKERPEEEEEQ